MVILEYRIDLSRLSVIALDNNNNISVVNNIKKISDSNT